MKKDENKVPMIFGKPANLNALKQFAEDLKHAIKEYEANTRKELAENAEQQKQSWQSTDNNETEGYTV